MTKQDMENPDFQAWVKHRLGGKKLEPEDRDYRKVEEDTPGLPTRTTEQRARCYRLAQTNRLIWYCEEWKATLN
jgi:hypothetical protein